MNIFKVNHLQKKMFSSEVRTPYRTERRKKIFSTIQLS